MLKHTHTHTYNQEMGESEKREKKRKRKKEIIIFLFSTFLPSSSSRSILTSVLGRDFATIGGGVLYRERESKSLCFESCRADGREGEDLTRPFAGACSK